MIPDKDIVFIRKSLLDWSKSNYRYYPWRDTNDSYKILIAEILLQRTKADQVNQIYNKFIEKYPNFEVINETDINVLLTDLKSLGLHWRVTKLKTLAKIISEMNAGKIPETKNELIQLPGIGDYIAGAYLISAHNKKIALLDTNIAVYPRKTT